MDWGIHGSGRRWLKRVKVSLSLKTIGARLFQKQQRNRQTDRQTDGQTDLAIGGGGILFALTNVDDSTEDAPVEDAGVRSVRDEIAQVRLQRAL